MTYKTTKTVVGYTASIALLTLLMLGAGSDDRKINADVLVAHSDNANSINVSAPASLAANWNFKLPPDDGASGQFLRTNGTGVSTWADAAPAIGGTVTGATLGSIFYAGTGGVLAQANATLFFDQTNGRVGLANTTPTARLTVNESTAAVNAITVNQSNTGRGILINQTSVTGGRGLEINVSGASNASPAVQATGTHPGKTLSVSGNTGTTPQHTTTSDNLSTTMTGVGSGLYGSVRTASSASTAGVIGEVIGQGVGYGFFAVRNSAGKSLGLATNIGAAVGLSPSYAMSPANNYNLTMPLTQGSAGTTLSNNGAGTLTWVTAPPAPSIGGVLTSASAGSVLFAGSGTFAQDNLNFFWNDTTNRLGLGTATPGAPLDIGATSTGENEVLRFTYTPDPDYHNYITSGYGGGVGQNEFKFYLKNGGSPGYVNALTVSDSAVTVDTKLVLSQDVGIGLTESQTALGILETSESDLSDSVHLVMSYLPDRLYSNAVANNFSGGDDAGNNIRFLVQTGTGGVRVNPLTLRGNNSVLVNGDLDVDDDTIRLMIAKTPASASDTCDQGEIAWDTAYIYTCVATNTWKRSALSTW